MKNRTIDGKLLAILLAVAATCAGGIHLLHGYQARRTAGILLERSRDAGRRGKVGDQVDLLGRYLAYRPGDLDALEEYGLILAKDGAPRARARGLEALESVLARDAGRPATRRAAAGLALALGQADVARAHYQRLESAAPGGDADAEEALGRCEEDLKGYPEAVAWLEKAIARDPGKVDAHSRLARLLRAHLRAADRADLVMDARQAKGGVIAKNPDSARAYLERSSYRREFAIPGGDDDIRRAMGLAPDDAEVILAATRVVPADEAVRLLGRGVEAHPDDARLVMALAMAEAGAGGRDRAIGHLKEGIGRLPGAGTLRWALAELEIDGGRRDEAAAEIGRLRSSGYPGAPLDFLDARLLVDAGRWTEAARLLSGTAPTLEPLPGAAGLSRRAFLLLARCHYQLGNPDMRYAAARRAVALESSDPSLAVAARAELSSALAGLGKLDEAAEGYRIALRMPGAQARLAVELGRVLVAKNLRLPPRQRRWDEVERVLADSRAALPGSADLAILRAEVFAAQERLDLAGDQLKEAEAARPDAAAPRVALAALAERRGRPGEALAILEDARGRLGERPELLSALIRYWSYRPGGAGAGALSALVDAAGAVADESERRSLLESLADGFDRAGEPARSAAIRDRLVAEQPDHLGLRLAQLDAALRAGDLAAAGRVLEDVRRIEGPGGSLWRYGRAQVLIRAARKSRDPKGLDEARVLLAEARERRPGWARAALAAAELDDMRGDPGSALRGYLAALEGGERDPGAVRRAVQLLYARGRFAQADALLRRAQQEGALSPELGRLAADVALRARDDDRAIEIARRAVAGRPDSASDQTWLGQLLFAASARAEERGRADEARSRRAEAEEALARGARLAPADPDARVAQVLALAAWGRPDEALAAIRDAEATLRGPAGELALARCLEAVGQADRARAKYRAILRDRPDDVAALQASAASSLRLGEVREAEPPLRRLITLGGKTPREADWARRVLALALSAEGRGGASRARELLGLDDEAAPGAAAAGGSPDPSADDLRARAQFLARQPGRSPRRKAIEMIEALAARDEARAEDLFLRARLLASVGDWKRARASAQQLLAEDPADAALLEFLARGQIAAGPPEEATPWIEELARARPGAPALAELRARSLFARGGTSEAVALLVDLAGREPAAGLAVAGLLEEWAQADAAEALLRGMGGGRPDAKGRADASLALASLLGRRGRHAEAVAICEGLWGDPATPASRVSSVAIVALYTGQPGEDVLRRVEGGIEAALGRKPADIVLRFDRANLAILRGRYAEAEAMLRALHESEPGYGAPLNNLAWLLALRGDGGAAPLDLVDRAIALDGARPDLLDTRGLVLTLRGQADRAIGDLEESIAAAPSATSYLHLAIALRKAGRAAESADALAKARSSGLRPGDIHPLERPAYLELVAAAAPR